MENFTITPKGVKTFHLRTGEHFSRFVRNGDDVYTILDQQNGCGPRRLTRVDQNGNTRPATRAEQYDFCLLVWGGGR